MISRYKRKPVSQNLQINQSLVKASENHPLPEKVETYSNCLYGNQSKVTLKCKSESDISDTSDSLGKGTKLSWSESQSCVGLSTDSSSVISWGFDEFDQAATLQVQKIFDHIDEFLFEQKPSTLTGGLQEECQQWASCFPHLRIKGKQILAPLDNGYSWHSSYPCVSGHASLSTAHARDSSELGIFGTKCPFTIANDPSATVSFSVGKEEDDGEDEFGVIVSDGVIEEYLAFDSMEKQDDLLVSLDSLNMGYPSISPKCCKKEAILGYLFDDVWREAVGCLQDLLCRHWEESILDDEKHDSAVKTAREESITSYTPLQRLPLVLPPVPHFKIPAISPSLANRPQGGNNGTPRNLNNLMAIHGCPLQQRNLHLMEKSLDSSDKLSMRPTSAALSSGKSRTGRTLEHSCSSLSHNIPSARRRNPPRTLHPINSNPSRAGTPKIEELLRGMRLPTGSDQVPCSPVPFNRNNLLPPIGTSDQDHHFMPGSQRQTPDTSMGRSVTLSDSINPLQSRRGSAGPDSVCIGVSGVSASTSSIRWGHSSNKSEEDHSSGIPMKYPSRGAPK
ncbi:hypothetical protein XENTR_v10018224 [Xenopus tropicalis]|uniref:Family with sequence similarity 149 member B1 n=1 Tax=Xenopus tropicalis TaxID=8364 RepID=A0A6I8PR43_XENTR|nr:protein FAM149B1 [Xenopus tropicalis]NP_001278639.1 protein FAM149B1 [Xenopus tropicalis]XP_017950799.1 protein FAM149B1 isoform X1 [Xenopus tropicalis]KAE8590835.1 hypothetical protein XENTR_v10018224 [Xenopus tropicalis]|eukprot:XP_017950798.1 PREDICTED: protein FAM149B1 isoform X1 [Xenopus tropicalis]